MDALDKLRKERLKIVHLLGKDYNPSSELSPVFASGIYVKFIKKGYNCSNWWLVIFANKCAVQILVGFCITFLQNAKLRKI
mgnify:CR=1 FL=1